ncbi:ABC transporter permease [Paraburkholderia nemoris]|uniref:ABC transporter permease n=1 Tax=Paraburkholderia nemoris TaxID=2793076 RepID=UPI0038BA5CAB
MSDITSAPPPVDYSPANQTNQHRSKLAATVGFLLPGTTLFLLLFAAPAAIILAYSFATRATYGGVIWHFDIDSYAQVFGFPNEALLRDWDCTYLGIIFKSGILALGTALLALTLAYPTAWCISRQPDRPKYLLLLLVTLPFFINGLVRTYAWMLILRSDGLINHTLMALGIIHKPLALIYTPTAVVVSMVYQYLPFMVLPLFSSIEKMDFRLVEASRDLGAGHFTTMRRVVFPLTMPGIVAGLILVFIPALGNFIAPTLIGGGKDLQIGTLLAQAFLSSRDWPFGSAVAAVLGFIVIACLYGVARVENRGTLSPSGQEK